METVGKPYWSNFTLDIWKNTPPIPTSLRISGKIMCYIGLDLRKQWPGVRGRRIPQIHQHVWYNNTRVNVSVDLGMSRHLQCGSTDGLCFDMECNATIDASDVYVPRQRRGRSHVWRDVNNAAAMLRLCPLTYGTDGLYFGIECDNQQRDGVESWFVIGRKKCWCHRIFIYA